MGSGRSYLTAFGELHHQPDPGERARIARAGLAAIAQLAEREPAPLEGIAPAELVLAVRAALGDGLLAEVEWLEPAAGAIALFELAQALPAGPERRELGRRVLTRLRDADRDTFVRLLVALARSSPKVVANEGLRARLEVVLSAPLTAPGAIGVLAIGLLAQPQLAQSWAIAPATGSLPGRRLAARLFAHGAREALHRLDGGDRGGVQVIGREATRGALERLLGDREALVWRFAAIARGMLAHVDSELADDIDRELLPSGTNTQLRRASASAAAALERGGAAQRWAALLIDRAASEPGVARGTILGLAGLAIASPEAADDLALALVRRAPFEAAEALAELRREERQPLLPRATAIARTWTRQQLDGDSEVHGEQHDDGRWALVHALDAELATEPRADGLGIPIAAAREALDQGDIPAALRQARDAVDEITAAADWLERATDDDPVDRRHSMRLLRELDRELLSDNALTAVLAVAPDTEPARAQYARALAAIESALLAREARPELGAVAHNGLRVARLRALVRLLDGVRATGDADLGPRLAAVRRLMARAQADQSSLRRAVWAAMTRAGDALLRDGHAEMTDLLLVWTTTFPDEDFAIVREASMVPDLEVAFDAYVRLHQATWAAADPDDGDAVRGVVEAVAGFADALPPEQSPRVESVRLAVARLGGYLARATGTATGADTLPAGALDLIADELATLARRVYAARQRLGLACEDASDQLEAAIRATADLDEQRVAAAIALARSSLPPAVAAAIERVLAWLVRRPVDDRAGHALAGGTALPGWVPLSRLLGNFYVVRPIGRGAGGSVLLAVRAEDRARNERELVALKVPDYSGEVARTVSEQEFERLFRDEAGALLALPTHPNIARFITFDASARPKPILVMELVRGTNLERTLEGGALSMVRALEIVDDLLSGLGAMHAVHIAHLDVKPANIVLRERSGEAVLVDFGLAGRRIRAGCGSAHYGAAEIWLDHAGKVEPFAADVYAAACVAFEILTNHVLIRGDTMKEVMDQHFSSAPGGEVLARLGRTRELAPLSELLRAATARDPNRRPSAARLRAGFTAIAPELRGLRWPLVA
jgi:hypothetical protein